MSFSAKACGVIFANLSLALMSFNSLSISLTSADKPSLTALQSILKSHPGNLAVQIKYTNPIAKGVMNLGSAWHVKPTQELLEALKNLLDIDKVCINYESLLT